MHTKAKSIIYCLCFILLTVSVQRVYAGTDNPVVTVLDGSKNQIAKDSVATSVDSLFFSGSFSTYLVKPYPVKNVISFHINEQALVALPDSFKAVVHLRVYYVDSLSHPDSINDLRLVINYKGSASYAARQNFVFGGAYSVKIKVLNDTIPASAISALVIENEIIPSRDYVFSCTNTVSINPSINFVSATADELTVSWANRLGVDETDVEWAFIDSSALASGLYTVGGSFNPDLIFTNNATRITVAALSYNIPLIFPGAGSVFVRARAVQFSNGKRITSRWTSDFLPTGMLKYNFSGHEKNLNWQSSVSFAEEGKRKVVVQYFDGSLRGRQTVTKDNSTNTTVTAETFYDYQGRPAIQVLPAPSINSIIKYTANFNRYNGAEYDKSVFDSVIYPNTACSLVAPSIDSSSGAAWYYSSNNALVGSGVNRFIPQSYGYAFTQTEYTQDNTGRVSRQSGVGQDFMLNTGHETKYYYSITPDQNELDALFGTEAGDHTHYFKNAVRDANGQYSISYVDMHGRTVATALAGHTPAVFSKLSSYSPSVVTQTLADAGTNITDGLAMTSHKSLLVNMAGPQHFVYALSPQSFQEKDCSNTDICYDCLYDLTITITDDCNNQKLGGHPLVITRPNIAMADAVCNGTGISVDTTIILDEGEYQVTKTLSISQAKQKEYFQNVYLPHNTCKTLADFITTQQQLLPHGNCDMTCVSCRESVGSLSGFGNSYMTKVYGDTTGKALHQAEIESAYNSALEACDQYCDDSVYTANDFVRQAMLEDMSPPSGQYADPDSAQDIHSIFYKPSSYSTAIYQQVTGYKDEAGKPDSVVDNITGKPVPPQQLDAMQFSDNFKPSWAESLLSYHPEYCKLQAYQNHYNAYTWQKKFEVTTSYADAVTKGYNHPLSGANQDPLASDPAFSTNLSTKYSSYSTATKGSNTQVLTMWQVAILGVRCPQGDTVCIQDIVFNTHDYSLHCAADSNQAWRSFQQLYSASRSELLNNYYAGISCTVPTSQLLADNHILHFNTSTTIINDNGFGFTSSSSQQVIRDSGTAHMKAAYQSNCEAYKTIWTQQLLPGYTQTQANTILPMLVDVCITGSDADHPFGSRDISTESPSVHEIIGGNNYWVRSFDDVINVYNAANRIAISDTTNADVITMPASYYKKPAYTQTVVSAPSVSQCDLISFYHSTYFYNALPGETFSQYMKRTQNTDISDDDLQSLVNSCAASGPCNYLDHPVTLPPVFQTGVGNACTDCYEFGNLVAEYINNYGDSLSPAIADQTDTTQLKANTLFTNFMNNHLGYSLNITDYLNFMNQCNQNQSKQAMKMMARPASQPMLCGGSKPAYPLTQLDRVNNCTDSTFFAVSTGTEMYNHYLDSLKGAFDSLYFGKCLQAYKYEMFTVADTLGEYHYTLYYYDQAGNLVQTIPPRAVRPNWNATYLAQVKVKRAAGDTLRPGHDLTLATQYRYNTLNQVVAQISPDGGTSLFFYDRLGRLVLSKNAKQSPVSKYSYTAYDPLGRITEVGELTNTAAMNSSVSKIPSQLQAWLGSATASRTQITHTGYDIAYFGIDSVTLIARNLRNRVSYVQYFKTDADQYPTDNHPNPQAGTFYSYDVAGNVDTLLQDFVIGSLPSGHNRFFKKIVYTYDLISGKVNSVAYNPGLPDAFYHRYTYDAENRITNVETSTDNIYWENEAFYKYFYHGPLARTVVGQNQVQGVDYAYTLQGWLKGINASAIGSAFDMGNDGYSGSYNQYVARDVYGFALHYFGNDYKPIYNLSLPFARMNTSVLTDFKPLYNGNIAAISQNQVSFTKPLLFAFSYDQLNRLVKMRAYKNNFGTFNQLNNWTPASIDDYSEDISYDANGNILKYKRFANSTDANLTNAAVMDSLNYYYEPNSNRLDRITDNVAAAKFSIDIDSQPTDNYSYDAIGNLIRDSAENIKSITWNVYGKIQQVLKRDNSTITYYYDASGNRLGKVVAGAASGNGETWYVHDASGNTMAVYTVNDNTVNSGALTLSEQSIYGSSRLGIYKPALNLATYSNPKRYIAGIDSGYYSTFTRGIKLFELTNHLGNVLATITDKKIGFFNGNGVFNHYEADVVTANDYYPGGMQMPGRSYTASIASNYRYGFNGKEMDNETYGYGNEYDYGFRIYNPRIGRFLSVDPLTQKYPELTPYQFASNRPIDGIDRDGLEYISYIPRFNTSGRSFNDYVGAFDNGVIDILNLVPTLWNSGVSTVQSINRGTYGQDVKVGAKQTYNSVKQSAKQLYNHPLQTLTSPQALEYTVSAYITAKVLPVSENSGNLLKPTKTLTSVEESSVVTNKIVAQGINGAKFTQAQIAKILAPTEGDVVSFYRGMTGSETGQGSLFLATTKEYAASYSSNVQEFQISRSGFKRLINEGLIETKSGINLVTGAKGSEIAVPNQAIKDQILKSVVK